MKDFTPICYFLRIFFFWLVFLNIICAFSCVKSFLAIDVMLILHKKNELTELLFYSDLFSDIGELMIEQFTRKPRARRRMFLTDPWSCFCCASILIDPVSVACGHTACKQCLSKVSQIYEFRRNVRLNVWEVGISFAF